MSLELLLTRRSVRRFTDEPVPDELLENLLRAAMAAPSGRGTRPWHFVVTRDRQRMQRVKSFHRAAGALDTAALAILVVGDPGAPGERPYWLLDCAVATENILLAAHAQGLGAVWIAVHPREYRIQGCREVFGVPERYEPVALVAVGWPAVHPEPRDHYDPSRVHFEEW